LICVILKVIQSKVTNLRLKHKEATKH